LSDRIPSTRLFCRAVFLLLLSLAVADCGAATATDDWQRSPLGQASLPAVATDGVALSATAMPTKVMPTATPTTRPTPEPIRLVVLHTNDNWGETEPCG
jgi:hypothetical protein